MLTYEGHDESQRRGGPNPKEVDQPLTTLRGSWTENGKFFRAAMDFKSGLAREAGADQSLREDFAWNLELQRFLRIDRCEHRVGWKPEGVQVFAETGREEIIQSRCRAFTPPIDSNLR